MGLGGARSPTLPPLTASVENTQNEGLDSVLQHAQPTPGTSPTTPAPSGVLISLIVPGLISMSIEETAMEPASNKFKRRVGGLVLVAAGAVIGLAGVTHLVLYSKDSF